MHDSHCRRWHFTIILVLPLLAAARFAAADPPIPLPSEGSEDPAPATKPEDWTTKVYAVDDLVPDAQLTDLVNVVTTLVEPSSWDHAGGQASAAAARLPGVRAIVVRQTAAGHGQVADLLERLRRAIHPDNAKTPGKEAPGQRVAKALARPVDFSFQEAPLDQVVEILGRQHGVKIELDRAAFRKIDVSPELPVTLRLSGISLRSALTIMTRRLKLVYAAVDDKVLITTHVAARSVDGLASVLVPRVYRIDDLAGSSGDGQSALENLITTQCSPTTWDEVGGDGSLVTFTSGKTDLLLVLQTEAVQFEVADLLTAMRRAVKAAAEGKIDEPFAADPPTEAERRVRDALARPFSCDYTERPLFSVSADIAKKTGVNVFVDRDALDEVGIGPDQPISLHVSGISLRSVLRLLLRELDLTYVVRDECLWITTPEETESRLTMVVYAVPDLALFADAEGKGVLNFAPLLDLVIGAVMPTTWDEVGGPGAATGVTIGETPLVVISQTRYVHEEVLDILRALRQFARRQAAGETPNPAMLSELAQTPAEKAIYAALGKSFTFKFIEVPLEKVAAEIGRKAGINVQLDRRALDDVGIATDTPITKSLSGITLRSTLRLLLRELDLTYVVQDEVLLITTPEEAECRLDVGLYPISDLAGVPDAAGGTRYDYEPFIRLITETTRPTSWDDVGGPGSIGFAPFDNVHALVVSQTLDVHDEIAALLGTLREVTKLTARDPDFGAEQPVFSLPGDGPPGTAAVRRALKQKVSLDYREKPLVDVVDDLKGRYIIEIQLDKRALDDVGVGTDTPVSIQLKSISLRSALHWLLLPLDLTFVIQDEVLLITTPEEAESRLRTRIYPVGDLLGNRRPEHEIRYERGPLGDIIVRICQPTSWDAVGGPGSIGTLTGPRISALVVSQDEAAHDQIEQLLNDLRRLRAKEEASPR